VIEGVRPEPAGEPAPDPTCELCQAARITPWHHEDEVCWVADCEVCGVPMVVWRHHGNEPPVAEREHMLARLGSVADARLGVGTWTLDPVMRQIPSHFHAHARDRGWWWRRMGAPVPPSTGSPG
jgi:hypothetical protein